MQNAAFRAAGLDWGYALLDVPATGLAAAFGSLRDEDCAGANVTIPHKLAALGLVDAVEGDAAAAGAVNTVRKEGRRLVGLNTDVTGIRVALGAAGVEAAGARVVVLGAGGAARAAAVALAGAEVTYVARRPEAAEIPGAAAVLGWDRPWQALVRHADLLLNATPLGRREEMPLRPGYLPPRGAVIDLVYVPGGTPLVRRARSLGIRTVDGWSVLLSQGAAAFQAWTGLAAPIEAMREALEAVPAPRGGEV